MILTKQHFLLILVCLHGLMHASFCDLGQEREAELLSSMWSYTPELPRSLLSAAVGMQGDRTRLERVMGSIMRGGWCVTGVIIHPHSRGSSAVKEERSSIWTDYEGEGVRTLFLSTLEGDKLNVDFMDIVRLQRSPL